MDTIQLTHREIEEVDMVTPLSVDLGGVHGFVREVVDRARESSASEQSAINLIPS